MDTSDAMLIIYTGAFILFVIFLKSRKRSVVGQIIETTEELPFSDKFAAFFFYSFLIIDIILTLTAITCFFRYSYDGSYLKGGVVGLILVSILLYGKTLLSVKIGVGGIYSLFTGFVDWNNILSIRPDTKRGSFWFRLKTGESFEFTFSNEKYKKIQDFIESRIGFNLKSN